MKGHRSITTSLRPEEIRLLDHHATTFAKGNRSGLLRAMIRFALEHIPEFIEWAKRPENKR